MPKTLTVTPCDELARDERFLSWLCDHGLEPSDVYRVEIVGGRLTAHRYDRNQDGAKFVRADGEPAVREPLTVACRGEVPA